MSGGSVGDRLHGHDKTRMLAKKGKANHFLI